MSRRRCSQSLARNGARALRIACCLERLSASTLFLFDEPPWLPDAPHSFHQRVRQKGLRLKETRFSKKKNGAILEAKRARAKSVFTCMTTKRCNERWLQRQRREGVWCQKDTYRETHRGQALSGPLNKQSWACYESWVVASKTGDRTDMINAIKRGMVRLVWFGLVGLPFNASLEPQPRARRGARLAEDAPARNAFWTGRARPNPGTACAA